MMFIQLTSAKTGKLYLIPVAKILFVSRADDGAANILWGEPANEEVDIDSKNLEYSSLFTIVCTEKYDSVYALIKSNRILLHGC